MTQGLENLHRLTLRDVEIIRDLGRLQSLRELARRLDTAPSQISRIVARVEKALGFKLLERSVSGIVLTERGRVAVERFADMCAILDETRADRPKEAESLVVGSSAFLGTRLVAPATSRISTEDRGTTFWRLLELQPDDTVMLGLRGAFSMAVHIGKLEWPRTWTSRRVGPLRWHLYARAGHPLGAKKSLVEADLSKTRFLYPVYWTPSGPAFGNDSCPLKRDARLSGSSTAAADAAVVVIRDSDQVGFLPEIVARDLVSRGELETLHVRDWPAVERPVFLSARAESVGKKIFERLAASLAATLVVTDAD